MEGQAAFKNTGGRRADRVSWRGDVQFRSGTRRANVKVSDVSPLGARIEGVFLVHEDDRFFVKFPGMESLEARVAWVEDFQFGCEFLRPLNPAVLDALTKRR
ncbi:MAG: PilZ domain-containing protein [Sphingomonadales bacterium]|nr:PilZ domain-containing protein [Sphingomonadales bacterium]